MFSITSIFTKAAMSLIAACLMLASCFSLSAIAEPAIKATHHDALVFQEGALKPLGALAAGRPSVLVFWAVDCGYCMREVPALNALHNALSEEVLILAVNQDNDFDDLARIPEYVAEHQLRAQVVQDPGLALGRRFAVPGTPTVIVLDKAGELVSKSHGELEKLETVLKRLI